MRIFVTGGTGFIGTHAVRELTRRGHTLLLLSRKPIAQSENAILLRGDLSDLKKLQSKIKRFKPEAILHLAWEAIPDYSPEISLKNLLYGIDVVRLAKLAGAKKIVMSGSCWEYGAETGRIDESAELRPKSAFAAAKVALNILGKEIAAEAGIDLIWLRIFYAYGRGQKSASLMPHLMELAARGKRPKLNNPDGGNDFIHAEDVAAAVAVVLEKHKGSQSGVYNVGSGKLTSVASIVNRIYGKNILKNPAKTVGFYANISLIKKEIGWEPSVSIESGIRKFYLASMI